MTLFLVRGALTALLIGLSGMALVHPAPYANIHIAYINSAVSAVLIAIMWGAR